MTAQEVATILRLFETNWPGLFDVSRATIDLWTAEVGHLNIADCVKVARHIIETKERPPTVALFLAEYKNATRAHALPPPAQPTDPPGDWRTGIAAARAVLQSAKGWAPPDDHVALKVVSDG